MSTSTATADTLLRQAWLPDFRSQAGGLAPRGLNVLLQVRLAPSGLHAGAPIAGEPVALLMQRVALQWVRRLASWRFRYESS